MSIILCNSSVELLASLFLNILFKLLHDKEAIIYLI